MNKHTPAPWSIKKRGGSYLAYDLEGNTEGKIFRQNPTIAQIHFRNHYNHDGLLDENGQNFRNVDLLPVEANAKLIAAAPELLEALESITLDLIELRDHYKNEAESFEGDERQMCLTNAENVDANLKKVKSAIQKATGGEI